MPYHLGSTSAAKRERARDLLSRGADREALRLLEGACYGTGYDTDYFELMGRALLATGSVSNAGRFLFLSGARSEGYALAIRCFISANHDPDNHRQLLSALPHRVKTLGSLKQFPEVVAEDLRLLGWPDDLQRLG